MIPPSAPSPPAETSGGHRPSRAAAVVLATTPAARSALADGTVLDRLAGQLDTLPVRDVHVVARTAVAVGPGAADGTRGLVDDLRSVAKVARASSGPVAVLPGDLVAHREALAMLLEHPARDTAALVAADGGDGGPLRPPVRVERGRVAAAGSSYHRVVEPNGTFRGVLQVGEADLGGLAGVAEELAEHVQGGRLGTVSGAEVGDLILVGLVRAGVPVRAAMLGPLRCDRVTGPGQAADAVRRLAEVDETAARLDAAIKSDDGFVATHLVSSWSAWPVRLCARLSLTPNAVTGMSLGLAALAAVWFSAGERPAMLAGAGLVLLSFVLDCVDGQLARFTRAFSPLGAWLDAISDRAKEYLVYVGLAAGYTGAVGLPGGIWALAVSAMALQTLRHTIDFSFKASAAEAGRAQPERPRSLADPGDVPPQPPPPSDRRSPLVRLSRRFDQGAVRWLRKIVVLPIGERMALIAVTAGLFDARVTFLALLGWGGLAMLYTVTGRVARSVS
ncbi:CDP-alcohol phosphatidyltransferase family protein [Spongiactinospora sp. 9N601]|uniref:CDP-alcohol phosphatidyltransferase family protein n=1 Tax=Spongiactinospora sp. 9N601 TaxID=3375149 RepID=UPI003789342C